MVLHLILVVAEGLGLAAAPVALFDGKTLNGWVAEGPHPAFEAREQQLLISGRGNAPNWLHTAREYENFKLRFEYKLAQWAEAAVILRAPRLGRPAQAGLSIYLAHDFHPNTPLYAPEQLPGPGRRNRNCPFRLEPGMPWRSRWPAITCWRLSTASPCRMCG